MKLTPVTSKYRDKFVIEVEFMCGDADSYETEDFVCKDENECQEVMEALAGDIPTAPGSGGGNKAYREWGLKVFKSEDFIPYDSHYDCRAAFDGAKAFYYDKDGIKFNVEF